MSRCTLRDTALARRCSLTIGMLQKTGMSLMDCHQQEVEQYRISLPQYKQLHRVERQEFLDWTSVPRCSYNGSIELEVFYVCVLPRSRGHCLRYC